jgi:ubiquinone biosynthesis protein
VEIQPQLVLLQKTLLNIEGLGRQLDPDLDLWVTAKPFLERWMKEQIGLEALKQNTLLEAGRWAQLLPQLPRLAHAALTVASQPKTDASAEQFERLLQETRQTRRWLQALVLILAISLLVLVVPSIWPPTA